MNAFFSSFGVVKKYHVFNKKSRNGRFYKTHLCYMSERSVKLLFESDRRSINGVRIRIRIGTRKLKKIKTRIFIKKDVHMRNLDYKLLCYFRNEINVKDMNYNYFYDEKGITIDVDKVLPKEFFKKKHRKCEGHCLDLVITGNPLKKNKERSFTTFCFKGIEVCHDEKDENIVLDYFKRFGKIQFNFTIPMGGKKKKTCIFFITCEIVKRIFENYSRLKYHDTSVRIGKAILLKYLSTVLTVPISQTYTEYEVVNFFKPYLNFNYKKIDGEYIFFFSKYVGHLAKYTSNNYFMKNKATIILNIGEKDIQYYYSKLKKNKLNMNLYRNFYGHKHYRKLKVIEHMKLPEFTVVSYNILDNIGINYLDNYIYCKFFEPALVNWKNRKKNLEKKILSLNSDIVCVQEMSKETLLSFEVSKYKLLHNVEGKIGIFYNPFKFELMKLDTISFDEYDDINVKTNRYVQIASFKYSRKKNLGGTYLIVINTHLKHITNLRIAQEKRLVEIITDLKKQYRNQKNYNFIITCDLNSEPFSAVYNNICSKELNLHSSHLKEEMNKRHSFFNEIGARLIDYIFFSAENLVVTQILELPTVRMLLPDSRNPSDHLPLLAKFAFKE